MNKIVLGLGSNLGDRELNLNKASELIIDREILSEIKKSKIFVSKALLKEDSPKEWNLEFFNIAICGYSNLKPNEILNQIKQIEIELGRNNKELWAPREIDIDILAYNEDIYSENNLTIPHKELLNREFAIIPFSQVWDDWKYPVKGKFYNNTMIEIVKNLRSNNSSIDFHDSIVTN